MASLVRNAGSFFPFAKCLAGVHGTACTGVVHPLISPHRGDGDLAVAGLAVPAQPLMARMRRLPAVLAVAAVIDHQHPAAMRRGRRVRQQQLQPARVDPLRVPARLRQEELQPLHHRMPGTRDTHSRTGHDTTPRHNEQLIPSRQTTVKRHL
jgi:hypothetical protein